MERCNKPARSYSWFNGFRACDECMRSGKPHEFDPMVATDIELGPCDVPLTPASHADRVSPGEGTPVRPQSSACWARD